MKGFLMGLFVVLVVVACAPVEEPEGAEVPDMAPVAGDEAPAPRVTTAVPVTGYSGDQEDLLTHPDAQVEANKRLAYDFFRVILRGQRLDRAAEFMAEDYIQHNPNADTGMAGFIEYFEEFGGGPTDVPDELDGLIAIQAEDDLVTLSFVREYPEPGGSADQVYTTTWFDMFRVADGRIVEHWDPATK